MKSILVRPANARNEETAERMRKIGQASHLVEEYIRQTTFSRDDIIEAVVNETGVDAGTVNWMMV